MRAFSVLLGLATFVTLGSAQDAPVRTLRDVKSGMSKEMVLTSLGSSYLVTRMDDAIAPGFEELLLFPKGDLQLQGESLYDFLQRMPTGRIAFYEGRVCSVVLTLQPILKSDDDVRFAKQLFFLLYNQADSPNYSNDSAVQRMLDKISNNKKQIVTPIDLSQIHSPTGDLYELSITVKGEVYTLDIFTPAGKEPSVTLARQLFYTPPTPSK
jgi:hypothetical protein